MSSSRSSRQNSFSSQTFEDWRDINSDIIPFLEFFSCNIRGSSIKNQQFILKRTAIHQRVLQSIKDLCIDLDIKEKETKKKLDDLLQKEPNSSGFDFIYDDISTNMKIRHTLFLRRLIWEENLSELRHEMTFYALKKGQSQRISQLLNSKVLPPNIAVKVTDSFLDSKFIQNPEFLKKIEKLTQKMLSLRREIQAAPLPLWVSNFSKFFSNLVHKALQVIDAELFYFPFLDDEISFMRCLFNAQNSINGRAIDNFIVRCSKNDFSDFPDRIIEFCAAMVPEESLETPKEQSVSLLLFFRAIMDRVYETNTQMFAQSPLSLKSGAIYATTMSQMTLPKGMSPAGEPDDIARDCFISNELYRSASETFLCSYFTVNPIDGLFYVHSTMTDIHKAAITTLVGRTPTQDELKQILGFDDLFSLFYGVLIASDVPDPFQLHEMMQKFSPRSCLSPMFEYANANLEALVLHCQKLCE